MADNVSSTGSSSLINSLNAGITQDASKKGQGMKSLGKDEFLTMLVTQLKNQDPMDPVKNEDFAAQLAQFSSLEQLIGINGKIGESGNSNAALSSYASFLGREVSVKSEEVSIQNGEGGSVNFSLPSACKDSTLELMRADGSVAETIDVGELESGRHRINLENLDLPDGTYTVKMTTQSYAGQLANPETEIGGIVTGFVPGDSPLLLIGEREVKVSDVSLVQVAPNTPVAS